MKREIITKSSLIKASHQNLIRLAKFMEVDHWGLDKFELVEELYFEIKNSRSSRNNDYENWFVSQIVDITK